MACDQIAHTAVDGVEETATAGSSSLSYTASSDRCHYVWATAEEWEGSCRQLVLKLRDGGAQRANFRFR